MHPTCPRTRAGADNVKSARGFAAGPKVPVYSDASSCANLNAQLSAAGKAIASIGIGYRFHNLNSNSVARELLENVGLPQQRPDVNAPGWKTDLGGVRQPGPVSIEPIR